MQAQHVLNDLDKTTRQAQLHFIFSNIYQIKFFFCISYFQIYIQSNSLLVTIYWNGNHSTKMLCTQSLVLGQIMRIYASPFSSLSYQEFKTGYQLLKSIFKLLYNVYKEKNKPNYLKILEIHL